LNRYDKVSSGKVLQKFIDIAKVKHVKDLVVCIWQQEKYIEGLSVDEKNEIEESFVELWEFLSVKYEKSNESEQSIFYTLLECMGFVKELDERIANLIVNSFGRLESQGYPYGFGANLVRLSSVGEAKIAAQHLGIIFNVLPIPELSYLSLEDNLNVATLVKFLFEQEQNKVAIEFCNRMVAKEYEFLRPIYDQYCGGNGE
jgi:hypothetical protein